MATITRAKCAVVLLSETRSIDSTGKQIYSYLFNGVPDASLVNANTANLQNQQQVQQGHIQDNPRGDSMKNLGASTATLMQPISFQATEPGLFEINQQYWLEVQQA